MKKILLIVTATVLNLFLISCSTQNNDKHSILTAKDFKTQITLLDHPVIIDVRTAEEFNNGHINGAINIDWYSSNFSTEIAQLDKNTPVYIYCRSGGRSNKAAKKMLDKGFDEIIELQGGFAAWLRP